MTRFFQQTYKGHLPDEILERLDRMNEYRDSPPERMSCKFLDLSHISLNGLREEQVALLCGIISNMDGGVTRINLASNVLGTLPIAIWDAFCTGLSGANIQSIDLMCNGLEEFTPEAWITFGDVLKRANIQRIDLGRNGLGRLSPESWAAFCAAIKGASIQRIELGHNDLTEDQKQTIIAIMQQNKLSHSLLAGVSFLIANKPEIRDEVLSTYVPGDYKDLVRAQQFTVLLS